MVVNSVVVRVVLACFGVLLSSRAIAHGAIVYLIANKKSHPIKWNT